jgi:PIN domain nuclease of toxin-antitoxin system
VRLLLDTHVWLWQLLEPERLSRRATEALGSAEAELFLSPISVWETLILAKRGRIELQPDASTFVLDALAVSRTTMTPLTHEIAIQSVGLPGYRNRDPADRFLIATCLVEALTMVTADRGLRRYRRLETLW